MMNSLRFSPWLLFSIALHAVLLAVLATMRFHVPDAPDERLIAIEVVQAAQTRRSEPLPVPEPVSISPPKATPRPAPVVVPKPVVAPKPERKPRAMTKPVAAPATPDQEQVANAPGVEKPAREAAAAVEKPDELAGRGTESAAAPDVMTAPDGKDTAPPGVDGGRGAQGEGREPSGPTYGAAATGGPVPSYPKMAQERRLSGTVVVAATIDEHGGIEQLVVDQSSGHDLLDAAALRAARRWAFTPAMENGMTVRGTVKIRFQFAAGVVKGNAL